MARKKKNFSRRNKNKRKDNNKNSQQNRDAPYEENYLLTTLEDGNFKFEAYYALQGLHNFRYVDDNKLVECTSDEEKNQERLVWRDCISQILPASFRVAFDIPETLKQRLETELEELVQQQKEAAASVKKEDGDEPTTDAKRQVIRKIPFLPHAYQLGVDRKFIRKDPTMQGLFDWMKNQTSAGFITRQETVSMVPPVAMNPQPNDVILDMCAAPGSKTCQILEKLGEDGAMVANDSSSARAYMLVTQLRRIMHNNPVVLVTSCDAQFFPQTISFDKILSDVPCSGDATSRKNIGIWKSWNQLGALALHSLQLDIAWKGVALLKVGGYMCYSTCSYNPIENEAVVAELLRRAEGSLELVDVPLAGFKTRPGLSKWHVLAEEKSNRQMKNEKKKNNAKMRERREAYTKKVKTERKEEGDKKEQDDADKEAGAGSTKPDEIKNMELVAEENGMVEAGEADAIEVEKHCGADTEETCEGKEKSPPRPRFETPSSWDDETLIGIAKKAGLLHFKTIDDVPKQLEKRIKPSCFPPTSEEAEKMHLEKCIRCLAHDNDTGGFFVALLKKVAPISRRDARMNKENANSTKAEDIEGSGSEEPEIKRARHNPEDTDGDADPGAEVNAISDGDGNNNKNRFADGGDAQDETISKPKRELKGNRLGIREGGKHKDLGRDDFIPADPAMFGPIIDFYGLDDTFPKEQYMTRAGGDGKIVYYIRKSVKDNFIDSGIQKRVTVIGSGVKGFQRNTNMDFRDTQYRISQEGIHFLLPHMSKRIIIATVEDFAKCLAFEKKVIPIDEFSEQFAKAAKDFSVGPIVVVLRGYEKDYARKMILSMWRCRKDALDTLVNKAEIEGMKSKLAAIQEEEKGIVVP